MSIKVRFWLVVIDVIYWCGSFGSRAYSWALERAARQAYGAERIPPASTGDDLPW